MPKPVEMVKQTNQGLSVGENSRKSRDSEFTLPETNIAPESRPSQKGTSIPTIHFEGEAVSFREGSCGTRVSVFKC